MNQLVRSMGVLGALSAAALRLTACSAPNPMRLETALELKGPITMNIKMEGPTIEYRGTFISAALFEAVEETQTRIEWVLAAFGEPDRRSKTDTGGDLLVWDYRAEGVKGSALKVTDLGEEDNPTPPSMTVILEVVQGTVIRKWRG